MFPIRDHNPSGSTPYVTYALIAANIVIFALYYPLFSDGYRLAAFWQNWAMTPRDITGGHNPYTLITSMFLHAGFLHLGGNMLFLWIFGDNMEDAMGHLPFLGFYLICGVLAGMGQIIADPASGVPNIGASGAIAGVLGGYLLLYPKAKVDVIFIFIIFFKIFTLRAWIVLGVWFALQIYSGTGADMTGGGVAYWAHTGCFLAGVVLTLPVWLRRGGPKFWGETDGKPPTPPTKYPSRFASMPIVRRRKK